MPDPQRRLLPEQLSDDERSAIIQIVTTEHFTLQTAKAETTSETTGRSSVYLAALSSSLVALGFIGQVSQVGTAFYVFALLLFPVLFFIGVVTFARATQSSAQDFIYFRGLVRTHHLYLELAPQLKDYFVQPTSEDDYNVNLLPGPTWLQFLLTVAGMIAVINSVILAVILGLVLNLLIPNLLILPAAVGLIVFTISLVLHIRFIYRAFTLADKQVPNLFGKSSFSQDKSEADTNESR